MEIYKINVVFMPTNTTTILKAVSDQVVSTFRVLCWVEMHSHKLLQLPLVILHSGL